MKVLAFRDDFRVETGRIEEGVLVPQELEFRLRKAFEGYSEGLRDEIVEEFKRRSLGVLEDEDFALSKVKQGLSKVIDLDRGDVASFSVRFQGSGDERELRKLLLLAAYAILDPAVDPPENVVSIRPLGLALFGDGASGTLHAARKEELAGLLAYYPGVGYTLKALAEERGFSASFGLVWGPGSSRGGFAFGAAPWLASKLSSLELPGYVGFYSEVLG